MVVPLLLLGGCMMTPVAAVRALNESWAVLGPEHVAYVEDDPNLTEAQKQRRLEHLQEHGALLADLLKQAGGVQ